MKILVKIILMLFIAFSFITCKADDYAIGDTGPAGGLIFYDRDFYLEAAPIDQGTDVEWGGAAIATGATATGIGAGETNTATIVATLGAGTYAAKICDDLDFGGYSDWFLPSFNELNLMYLNLKLYDAGNFIFPYWSSSESSASDAYVQGGGGARVSATKTNTFNVRAARAFE